MSPQREPRILVACHPTIGDVVGLTPLFRWIREAHPNAYLVALTSNLAAPLLRGNPHLDEVLLRPRGVSAISFVAGLRRRHFDLALVTYAHNDSLRWAQWAGIPRRVVVGVPKASAGATEVVHSVPGEPIINWSITQLAGAAGVPVLDFKPDIVIPGEAREQAMSALQPVGRPFVAFQLGASEARKRWPAERFREVWEAIDSPAVIIGGPSEADLSRSAATTSSKPPLVLAGSLSLLETAAVLQAATVLVTNDTGAMHLSGAMETPTVAIFGPTLASEHPPFGDHTLLQGRDMSDITSATVINAVRQYILTTTSPKTMPSPTL